MSNPLFSTGTTKGGTTFFTRILSINRDIKVSSDPFLPLFRSLRTEIMRQKISPNFNGDQPLDDYYFSEEKIKCMKTIQTSELNLIVSAEELAFLKTQLSARMDLAAKELLPFLAILNGDTYFDLFQNGLKLLEKAYDSPDAGWTGFNDNWIIEFFPLLARAFTKAKFIVIVRDPRAAMASSMNLRKKEPLLVPLMYSFAHCWRKHIAFATMLMKNPLLEERLFVFRYEDLASEPERIIKKLCQFLKVEYDVLMLDTERFRPISGDKWVTYSNFDFSKSGIYTDSVDRWKKYLDKGTIEFIEFICEPEMKLLGYKTQEYKEGLPSSEVMRFMLNDDKVAQGWRGNHKSWDVEHAYELFRKQTLKINKELLTTVIIEKNFLFEAVYDAILSGILPKQYY